MSGLMNMVSRFARGARTNGRRPGAPRQSAGTRGMGGATHGRGGSGLEGAARKLLRRVR